MGLDVYFRRDIANVLQGITLAVEGPISLLTKTVAPTEQNGDLSEQERIALTYKIAVETTLRAVGLSFGLEKTGNGTWREQGRLEQIR